MDKGIKNCQIGITTYRLSTHQYSLTETGQ